MKKKETTKRIFRGRDAVLSSVIWVVVYLLVTYLLNGLVSIENLMYMFFGLCVFLLISVLIRNGW